MKAKGISEDTVLSALRAKVGSMGHVRRNGATVEAGTLDFRGFVPVTLPCFTRGSLLNAVNKLKRRESWSQKDTREQLLSKAASELTWFQTKYESLEELASVCRAIGAFLRNR